MSAKEIIEKQRIYLHYLQSLNKDELIQEIINLQCKLNMQTDLVKEYIEPIITEKIKMLQKELNLNLVAMRR